MSILSQAIYDVLAGDPELVGLLADYKNSPGIFTIHPVPGDAHTPYVVTVGEVVQNPWDTKTTRGRDLIRDVRAYAEADGNNIPIETIIERVRMLLHRRSLSIGGFTWVISNVTGPIAIDEPKYYGRVVSLSLKAQEE
jgi:hypothetical protein